MNRTRWLQETDGVRYAEEEKDFEPALPAAPPPLFFDYMLHYRPTEGESLVASALTPFDGAVHRPLL